MFLISEEEAWRTTDGIRKQEAQGYEQFGSQMEQGQQTRRHSSKVMQVLL